MRAEIVRVFAEHDVNLVPFGGVEGHDFGFSAIAEADIMHGDIAVEFIEGQTRNARLGGAWIPRSLADALAQDHHFALILVQTPDEKKWITVPISGGN